METESIAAAAQPGRRLRIAQVITSVVLGGGGQVMSALARNIDRTAFEMDVFCVIEGGELVDYIQSLGFRVEVIPVCRTHGWPRYDLARWAQLVSSLRRGRYDLVHTHLFRADLVGTVAAVAAGRRPIVRTLHNMGTRKARYHRVVDRVLNTMTRRIVCVSETQRLASIERDGFRPSQLTLIRNGVRVERFEAPRDRAAIATSLGLDPARPIVGTVGRLIREKGHRYLFDAIPQIVTRVAGAQFLLVGDGELRRELEARIAGLGGAKVIITGLRPDIPELLGAMDVFVFPSLSEGSPIAALEAMAAGVPLACSDIEPLQEIVHQGRTGLMFRQRDADALAVATCRLLLDRSYAAGLAARAREEVRAAHSEAAMARAYERLYRDEVGSIAG